MIAATIGPLARGCVQARRSQGMDNIWKIKCEHGPWSTYVDVRQHHGVVIWAPVPTVGSFSFVTST